MNIAETIVRKNAHNFSIFVTDKGDLTFQMDDGEEKHARALKDGKLLFIGTLEVVANGEIQEWKDMDLPEADFILLAEAQQRVRDALDEEQTMERLKREGEDKSNMLKRIDKWKKRVKWYRKERRVKKSFMLSMSLLSVHRVIAFMSGVWTIRLHGTVLLSILYIKLTGNLTGQEPSRYKKEN